jgi:peptide-methionine (R)-S-oxide reductase
MAQPASDGVFEVMRTEEEWRQILTPAQFAILRQEATEYAFTNTLLGETSPLLHEERDGIFHCAGCDLALYSSDHKYDSRTGWPSFWQALDDAVRTSTDHLLGYPRTEVHCRRCGGHLGHIFDDGPPPTGKRHCINGLAMTFQAA